MNLVIIEGVGKKDTIKKYLGEGYEVVVTKGHIRDLPQKTLGVNILKNFEPEYVIMPDKNDIVTSLKQKAKTASKIYLATDPDREGEAISWHLTHILNLNQNDDIRIVFNEISKSAITNALQHPRAIDQKLVNAQQARRVLDRLVGYKLSPILCKKIQPKLSAGRVQSVALKIVVDREKEINNFKPQEYWTLVANLFKSTKQDAFKANLVKFNNKKLTVENSEQMQQILSLVKQNDFVVSMVKKTVGKTKPYAPYTTSTMQQDALNKLGFNLKKASACAQALYEGVNIEGEGKVALVTYIRTDSVRVAPEAMAMAKTYIAKNYGEKYLPKTPNVYVSKTLAQDAHEAIRPITIERTPEMVKPFISPDNYKLYKIIYERFLASQMTESIYNLQTVEINNSNYNFKASEKTPVFDGYLVAYNYEKTNSKQKNNDDDEEELNDKLPQLNEGDKLNLINLTDTQKFTKPPTRYTEGTLVKEMEEKGIGRPATYTPTITTLASRNYTEKEGKFLKPTDLGVRVTEYLEKYFDDIMNVKFTANMEDKLDEITQKETKWNELIADFYKDFDVNLRKAFGGSSAEFKVPPVKTDEICEKCGSPMVIRTGKFGEFLACSNFPACKNIRSLKQEKPVAVCPLCGSDVYLRKSKRGNPFYACGSSTCNFMSWDLPLKEHCPKCNSYLVEKGKGKFAKIKCSNTECDYVKEN